jgi:hypothetical protein
MTLAGLAWSGFKLTFGLVSLATAWSTAVVKNGVLWARDSDEEKRELAAGRLSVRLLGGKHLKLTFCVAQKRFWSLDQEPLSGFRHAFFKTSSGVNIHYVINADTTSSAAKNIVFFIHGLWFPPRSTVL